MDGLDSCDRVLVPTDRNDDVIALDHAVEIARRCDAEVCILSVVNPYEMSSVTERTDAESRAEEVVAAAAERARDAGVDAEARVETGTPSKRILAVGDETDADVVAMGTHGRRGTTRYVVGSVAEKVVRHSPVPVLTVRIGAPGELPYRDVVVPTDGSEANDPAEAWGVSVAAAFDADVHALSVVEPSRLPGRSDEEGRDAAEAAVEEVLGRAERAGVAAAGAVTRGTTHEEILSYCKETGGDIVVMGTHGRSGLKHALIGSVAEKVIRLSDVPVLTVPMQKASSDGDGA
ncbi:Nucleotide-binding universal stress protein, UspA family [Halopelagius inordinatus]|uniref:Nucleotide-binding universal stress protein, UspA family n=1 Tax=Halopelagius inordinatus TaxID=553467 RepID=A0A1I2N4K8_9EURY|nr:universal stress protein [Halopelagius inordinatus]SFF97769.1 Nucleotide-binding universal stress protein, UspA family [Halopelagius inordinatus]